MNTITHKEFAEGYLSGQYSVTIDENRAGDFVLSDFADKHNKPAHYFWTWLGILLVVPIPIALLFVSWIYSACSFIVGLFVVAAARRTDRGFVIQNMVDDESFFDYVLMHHGAKIFNKEGQELQSEFLARMQSK